MKALRSEGPPTLMGVVLPIGVQLKTSSVGWCIPAIETGDVLNTRETISTFLYRNPVRFVLRHTRSIFEKSVRYYVRVVGCDIRGRYYIL